MELPYIAGRMELPYISADGNVNVHSPAQITVFGYDVCLLPNGLATIIDPPDRNDLSAPRVQWPLLAMCEGILRLAKIGQRGPKYSIWTNPQVLAHVIGSRDILLTGLTDHHIRPMSNNVWEFRAPPTSQRPEELLLYVSPRWAGRASTVPLDN